MHTSSSPIAIVGGGIAGLTAARVLHQADIPFVLYEAGPNLAGMAQTFKDEDGFSYDFGTHLITNRLAAAIGIADQCREVRYFGESIWLQGQTYRYPFGLMRVPRYALSALRARFTSRDERPPNSAADWFRATLGTALADEVAIPLVEAMMGVPATDLAPAVGDKLPSVLRTVMLRLAGQLTGRAVAIGYCRELPESPKVWHAYPLGGIGTLCAHLADGLETHIQVLSRVEKIFVESERVVGIQINGEMRPASAVMSTIPVNLLAKIIEGSDTLHPLKQFAYRPMLFVNLRLEGRNLLPNVVLWTPEAESVFFRLQEAPISIPWLAPNNKTLITADIGCRVGDTLWNMPDDALGERCVEHLQPLIPDVRQRYLGCRVLRTPIAYPVLLNAYEHNRQRLEQSTDIDGLYSIGRNGEFAHILMEDIYHRTVKKTRHMVDLLYVAT